MLTPDQLIILRSLPPQPNRLKDAMRLAGVTQVDVATGTGFTQSFISKLAIKRQRVTLETAARVASYFGCEMADLFPRETATEAA